jgi:hypothetical protein
MGKVKTKEVKKENSLSIFKEYILSKINTYNILKSQQEADATFEGFVRIASDINTARFLGIQECLKYILNTLTTSEDFTYKGELSIKSLSCMLVIHKKEFERESKEHEYKEDSFYKAYCKGFEFILQTVEDDIQLLFE